MTRARDVANVLSTATALATDTETAAAISSHNSATTSVHGISNTATLATQTYADSAVSTHAAAADPHAVYLKESEFVAAGKNLVINGGMDFWQRGTSFASSNSTYLFTADRWEIVRHGFHLGMTVSRQTSGLDGFRYCARIQRDSGNTSTNNLQFQTSFETSEVLPFINKTMTISFYARKSSTASSSSLNAQIIAGTGTDQPIKSYTGGTVAFQQTFTLTDSWQRFSFSGSVLSPYTEFGIWFGYTPSGTAGAADYVELTGVQIEQGSVATSFSRAAGNIQGELAACQRYYQRFTGGSSNTYIASGGQAGSSVDLYVPVKLTTTMRISPTAIDYSALRWQIISNSGTISNAVISDANPNMCLVRCTSTGLTSTTQPYMLMTATGADYLGFSAEL